MAASNLVLANAALRKLGARPMASWAEDSQNGRIMRDAFFRVRDAELQASRWRFALVRAALSTMAPAPAWGFARAFRLPADYLQLVSLGETDVTYLALGPEYRSQADVATWAIEGNSLLCDFSAPLRIRYVRRVEDPLMFDPLFDEALSCKLAWDICEAITQSSDKRMMAAEEYRLAVRAARRANALERHPDFPADGPWLMSRVAG